MSACLQERPLPASCAVLMGTAWAPWAPGTGHHHFLRLLSTRPAQQQTISISVIIAIIIAIIIVMCCPHGQSKGTKGTGHHHSPRLLSTRPAQQHTTSISVIIVIIIIVVCCPDGQC